MSMNYRVQHVVNLGAELERAPLPALNFWYRQIPVVDAWPLDGIAPRCRRCGLTAARTTVLNHPVRIPPPSIGSPLAPGAHPQPAAEIRAPAAFAAREVEVVGRGNDTGAHSPLTHELIRGCQPSSEGRCPGRDFRTFQV
jgi:hypothetical protein